MKTTLYLLVGHGRFTSPAHGDQVLGVSDYSGVEAARAALSDTRITYDEFEAIERASTHNKPFGEDAETMYIATVTIDVPPRVVP